MSTRTSYDTVAAAYEAAIGDELAHKPVDRALLGLVVEHVGHGPVLDAGGGPGHVAAWLVERGARCAVLDLSPAMAARAGRRGLPALAGDLANLPVRDATVAGIVCLFAVIHLDDDARTAAYREFARVLRPGGVALVAFHVRDADVAPGGSVLATDFLGHAVDLEFRYLRPDVESARLAAAGLAPVARVDRPPVPRAEHPSDRTYLLVRRPEVAP